MLTVDEVYTLATTLAPELRGRLIIRHEPTWPAPPGVEAWATRQRDGTGAICFVQTPAVEVALHELSHVLPVAEPVTVSAPTAAGIALQVEQVNLWLRGDHLADPSRLPWTAHGPDWLRRVVHLWCRAESAGIPIRQCDFRALDWTDHDISEYRARLGWEPTRCRGWSFAQIEAEPIPAYFSTLFEADKAAWLAGHEEST